MAGVPHRSLARSVREAVFRGRQVWQSVDDVSEDAIDEFKDYDDPETSLWADGNHGEHRGDVVLALAFSRPSIGKFALAMLWQDDAAIGDDLGNRIVQSDGFTPYIPAQPLHYHVSNPSPGDYARLALAAGNRAETPVHLSAEDFRQLIEDAYLARTIPEGGLLPKLQQEIKELIKRRFVEAADLRADLSVPIFDIRDPAAATSKIARAEFIRIDEFDKVLHDKKVGKKDSFVIYCEDGRQSFQVARHLRQTGKTLRILVGGFIEWAHLGFEVDAC